MKEVFFFTMLSIALVGCSTSKSHMPSSSKAQIQLTNLPKSLIIVQINDIRADKGDSENIKSLLKSEIENSLSSDNFTTLQVSYILEVDIVEYRSYFSLAVWNGSAKFRARLISNDKTIIGTCEGSGSSQRSNTMGYSTAKRVAQDAYNTAVADLLSNLRGFKLN